MRFVQDHVAPWPSWSAEQLTAISDREPSIAPAFQLERAIIDVLRR